MKYFLRSLRYLWPYRFRLGVAIVCVLCIAVLWGGGLGMMLPGAKILLSPEGLHGWAWNSSVQDKLQAHIVQRVAPAGYPPVDLGGNEERQALSFVLDVVSLEDTSPSKIHGLRNSDWIIGLFEANVPTVIRGDALAHRLADLEPNQGVDLLVYDTVHKQVISDETLARRTQGRKAAPAASQSASGPGKPAAPAPVHVKMSKESFGSRILVEVARRIPEPSGFSGRLPIFVGLLAVVLMIQFARAFFTYLQEYFVGTAIWRGIMDLRCDTYNTVLRLPTTFFSEKGVSDATSRFIQDTGELARGQNTLLGKTLVEPAKAIGSLVLALSLPDTWQLTLMAMVAGPPAFLLIRQFGKRMHKASRRMLEGWSILLATLDETLQGIRVVKAYTMEGAERKRFFRSNRQLVKQQNRMERLDAATGPTVETLGLIGGMAAAGVAGYLVFNLKMDPYVFLTWMGSLFALFDPVRKLAKVSIRFHASDAAAQRIFDLQDQPPEKFVLNAPALPRHGQSIEFRNVSFRYPGAAVDAVRGVKLTIRAGQTVAIVGPNGSGKTTLVSLLPRLMDPTEGAILIDGQDISQCSIRSLRRQIGLVTQDTVLFHATISENVSYGLRRAKPEKVAAAAQKAFVDEFVAEMPDGYNTMVGEHGSTLSGGQKQRIAIARAILRDPSILIFDEAMSQVDADSERRIHQVMVEFAKGRTTLMIAHRFATVLSADLIAVMDKGEIIDAGTHKELLGRCELYGHLYKTQFADSGG